MTDDACNPRSLQIDAAVAEFLESIERGAPLDSGEFLARHPNIADGLQEFLTDYQALQLAAPRSRSSAKNGSHASADAVRYIADLCRQPLEALRRFADYELVEEIARGGMGVVYKARQVTLNRTVALKMILAGQFASQAEVDRFYAEAKVAATLDHPNIVPIFEVGRHDGQHYFSMGYVAGESMAQRIARGPAPAREAAAIIRDVALAVHYAHQKGIIHRDLKPANILFDTDGRPRITDFGLAKCQTDTKGLTLTGQLLGTPSFMSPEQVSGSSAEIGPASDVYSLGSTLYALMTGRPPFHAASTVETFKQLLEQEPVSPQEFDTNIPRDLETIALKCLEKSPNRRYPSARALAEDLERFLADRTILARRSTSTERVFRWCKRNPVVAMLSGTVLVALLMGATISTLLAIQANDSAALFRAERDRAEKLLTKKTQADQRGARLQDQLAVNLFKRGSADYQAGNAARGIALLAGAYEAADADPPLRAWFRNLMSGWSSEAGRLCLHDGKVLKVAFSPDGRSIATGSSSRAAQLWDAQTGRPLAVPLQHNDTVIDLAFSPDGRTLLTACLDNLVRLWDVRMGRQLWEPLRHDQPIRAVGFSPDGRYIFTTDTKTARLWDAQSGSLLLDSLAFDGAAWAGAFSPDSRSFLLGGQTARLWNIQSGKIVGEPLKQAGLIRAVAFSPDGKTMLTGCADGSAQVWITDTGKPLGNLVRHDESVAYVAFSPDGRLFLTGGGNTVRLWDAQTHTEIGDPLRHEGPLPFWRLDFPVSPVAFSPDSRAVLTGSDDGAAHLWDTQTGKPLRAPLRHGGRVCSVAFSPDGRTLATASFDRTARLWDADPAQRLSQPIRLKGAVCDVSFDSDGLLMITAGSDGTVQIWDNQTGSPHGPPMRHDRAVSIARFSPHGQRVLTVCDDGAARQWDIRTCQRVGDAIQCQVNPAAASFSPDGRLLLIASQDGTVRMWDANANKPLGRSLNPVDVVSAMAVSPDGNTVALGTSNWTVELHDIRAGSLLHVIKQHEALVHCVAFSPNGHVLVTGSGDGTARLCDANTGEPLGEPMRHLSDVLDVAFSPDGRAVITGSADGTARLWDAVTGTPLAQPFQHNGVVSAVAFSPDGASVLTGCSDGTAQHWKPPPPPLPDNANLIRAWVKARTGLQVDSQGSLRYLQQDEWLAARKELQSLQGKTTLP